MIVSYPAVAAKFCEMVPSSWVIHLPAHTEKIAVHKRKNKSRDKWKTLP